MPHTLNSDARKANIDTLPDALAAAVDNSADTLATARAAAVKAPADDVDSPALTEAQKEVLSRFSEDLRTPELVGRISQLSKQHIEVFMLLPKDQRTLEALKAVADLTKLQAGAFFWLTDKECVLANLGRIPATVSDAHVNLLWKLQPHERTLNGLGKLMTLTDNQLRVFSYLTDDARFSEKLRKPKLVEFLSKLSKNHINALNVLEVDSLDLEILAGVDALTESQAIAFSWLSQGFRTLNTLVGVLRLTDLTESQAIAFSWLSKGFRTLDTLVEVVQVADLTKPQAFAVSRLSEDLRTPDFLGQVRHELREVHIEVLNTFPDGGVDLEAFDKLSALYSDQGEVFLSLAKTTSNFGLEKAHRALNAVAALTKAQTEVFFISRKNVQTIDGAEKLALLSEHQFNAFSELPGSDMTIVALDKFLDITEASAIAFSHLLPLNTINLKVLGEVLKFDLTTPQALAFSWIIFDLRTPELLEKVSQIVALNEYNTYTFSRLLIEQRNLEALEEVSRMSLTKEHGLILDHIKDPALVRPNSDLTIDDLKTVSALTKAHINIVMGLPKCALTVADLKPVSTLTKAHIDVLTEKVTPELLDKVLKIKLTKFQAEAFGMVVEGSRTFKLLVDVSKTVLTQNHCKVLTELQFAVRVVDLEKVAALTETQAIVFSKLPSHLKGRASLELISGFELDEAHIKACNVLPNVDLEIIKNVAALTKHQAKGFYLLVAEDRTSSNLVRMPSELSETKVNVLSRLPQNTRTMDVLTDQVMSLTTFQAKVFCLFVARDCTLANLAKMPSGLGYAHLMNLVSVPKDKRTMDALNAAQAEDSTSLITGRPFCRCTCRPGSSSCC